MKVWAESPDFHMVHGTRHGCSKFWPSQWMTEGYEVVLPMSCNPGKASIQGRELGFQLDGDQGQVSRSLTCG